MERRDFFKRLGCLIAGFAVAPVVIKTVVDKQEGFYMVNRSINGNDLYYTGEYIFRGGWNYNNQYCHVDLPKIPVNYKIGDKITSGDVHGRSGICTGFSHDNACVNINGECVGGKYYFMKDE